MKMSDSEGEFMCSQVSKSELIMNGSQEYGPDVVDDGEFGGSSVVSLENGNINMLEVGGTPCLKAGSQKVLYDNVVIEDISSDEDEVLM